MKQIPSPSRPQLDHDTMVALQHAASATGLSVDKIMSDAVMAWCANGAEFQAAVATLAAEQPSAFFSAPSARQFL